MRPTGAGRRRRAGEGELEVFCSNEQDDHPVDVTRWAALAREVLTAEGIQGDAELSVLYVDETSITELNRRFLGEDGPTDVLSFPLEEEAFEAGHTPGRSTTGPDRDPFVPGDGPLLLGDVVICPAVAARNAPGHAGSYEDELALLLVHGILHVLGMDHAEQAQAQVMRDRERELLERFHGPVGAGTEVPAEAAVTPDEPTAGVAEPTAGVADPAAGPAVDGAPVAPPDPAGPGAPPDS